MAHCRFSLMRYSVAVILAAIMIVRDGAEAQERPMFVCLQLPPTEANVDSFLKIEKAFNVSGAFYTTQVQKPVAKNRSPVSLDSSPVNEPRVHNVVHLTPPPVVASSVVDTNNGTLEQTSPDDTATARELANIELLFQDQLVNACKDVYPDILTRDRHSTPFRALNCSVLCVYGSPPVDIPDGNMCYLRSNFIGTLGVCKNRVCVVDKPFEFDIPKKNADWNPNSRLPAAPGYTPDVYAPPSSTTRSPKRS